MDLFAETALGSDAVAVSDDQHPDHQLRINRGPPGVAVVIGQLRAQIAQVETLINATQKVIVGNVGVEIECVKQPSLTTRSLTHHRRVLPQNRIAVDQTSTPRARSELSRSFSTELAEIGRAHV